MKNTLVACMIVLVAAGCIVKETRHTLYLEPDGSLSWTIVEDRVRSNADAAEERAREESEYLTQVNGQYPLAEALWSLGGFDVWTKLVKTHRPYVVVTEGRFDSVENLARQILGRLGLRGSVELRREGEERVLEITAWQNDAGDSAFGEGDPMLELLDDVDAYRIVITEGRFVRAEGFALEGQVAVPLEVTEEELVRNDGRLHLLLVWNEQIGDGSRAPEKNLGSVLRVLSGFPAPGTDSGGSDE